MAATTQGPTTAFLIVMEMVPGHAMVLSLMACALLASGVARLLTRPMYPELAAQLAVPAAAARAPRSLHGRTRRRPVAPSPLAGPVSARRQLDRFRDLGPKH